MTELSNLLAEIELIISNKNNKNWQLIDKDIALEKIRQLYQKISNINTLEVNNASNIIAENSIKQSEPIVINEPIIENKISNNIEQKNINPPSVSTEKIDIKTKSLNDILNQNRKNDLAEVLEHLPIKDLKASIGFNDKFSFINNLFDGDETAYKTTIESLNNCSSKDDANIIFNQFSNQSNWLKNTETVELLKDLVDRKFQ
jgi:hypothetical protein